MRARIHHDGLLDLVGTLVAVYLLFYTAASAVRRGLTA